MKKKCLIWCLVLLVLTGEVIFSLPVNATTTQEQLDDATSARDDAEDKLEQSESELSGLYGEKAELETALDTLNGKLAAAGEILEELDKSITEKKEQIDNTWGQVENLATQVSEIETLADNQYKAAKAQIKYAYESGDTIYMLMLASSATYADYINRASYLQSFTKYQQDSIAALKSTSQALQEKRAEYESSLVDLELEKAELDSYEAKVAEQYAQIKAMVDEAAQKVEKYQSQISLVESKISEYEADIASKDNDISTLKAKLEEEKTITAEAEKASWRDLEDISYAESDIKLLANIIYCEAGNEPYIGKVAVGAVVMNRVKSSVFPNTITGVIYQKRQFTPASSGKLALALSRDSADEECYRAAEAAMSGVNNIGDCLYFRTPTSKVNPKYTIGGHIFY